MRNKYICSYNREVVELYGNIIKIQNNYYNNNDNNIEADGRDGGQN